MNEIVSIECLIQAIQQLPSDQPVSDPQKWYKTQKEHWLGWLKEYNGPGAYNRKTNYKRSAKFAYNHIVEPKMLLWLIEAAQVNPTAINAAQRASAEQSTMQGKSAAIRRIVSWKELQNALWGTRPV